MTCNRGKMHVCNSRLVLVLLLIGWESGASFVNQSQGKEVQNQSKREWKPLYALFGFCQYLGSHAVKTITGLESTIDACRKMRVRADSFFPLSGCFLTVSLSSRFFVCLFGFFFIFSYLQRSFKRFLLWFCLCLSKESSSLMLGLRYVLLHHDRWNQLLGVCTLKKKWT